MTGRSAAGGHEPSGVQRRPRIGRNSINPAKSEHSFSIRIMCASLCTNLELPQLWLMVEREFLERQQVLLQAAIRAGLFLTNLAPRLVMTFDEEEAVLRMRTATRTLVELDLVLRSKLAYPRRPRAARRAQRGLILGGEGRPSPRRPRWAGRSSRSVPCSLPGRRLFR